MKSLQVYNGDLSLDSGGRLTFVQGTSKLVQDLTLWLQEPIGTSFTAPNFGSTLTGLVGAPQTTSTIAQIQTEVQRILGLYQSQQVIALKSAQNSSQLANWNKSEIINSINSIQVVQNLTSIDVYVTMTALNSSTVNLTLSINSNGVQVQNG
jgi:phage baseplate assembly protein W